MISKKISMVVLIILPLLFCALPINTNARLTITTQIATGIILNIQDKAIELEGGSTYYPVNKTMSVDLNPGDMITLEFYVDSEKIKYYVGFALGENTLKAHKPPEPIQKERLY